MRIAFYLSRTSGSNLNSSSCPSSLALVHIWLWSWPLRATRPNMKIIGSTKWSVKMRCLPARQLQLAIVSFVVRSWTELDSVISVRHPVPLATLGITPAVEPIWWRLERSPIHLCRAAFASASSRHPKRRSATMIHFLPTRMNSSPCHSHCFSRALSPLHRVRAAIWNKSKPASFVRPWWSLLFFCAHQPHSSLSLAAARLAPRSLHSSAPPKQLIGSTRDRGQRRSTHKQ